MKVLSAVMTAFLIGCATVSIPNVPKDKIIHVFQCANGNYMAAKDTVILFSYDGKNKTCGWNLSYRTIRDAVHAVVPNAQIESIVWVSIGGTVLNARAEHLVVVK